MKYVHFNQYYLKNKNKQGERVQPFINLKIQEAQQLMDELWQCGLRPTEGTGSAGSLAATEKHLQDMRKLVFEPCKIIVDGTRLKNSNIKRTKQE